MAASSSVLGAGSVSYGFLLVSDGGLELPPAYAGGGPGGAASSLGGYTGSVGFSHCDFFV